MIHRGLDLGRVAGISLGVIGLAFVSLFGGLVMATGVSVLQMLAVGVVGGLLMLLLPLPLLTSILVVVTLFVQGMLTYFGRFQQASWLPYLLSILLTVKLVDLNAGRQPGARALAPPVWNAWPVVFLTLYLTCLVFGAIVGQPPVRQLIVGFKAALPMWAGAALFYVGARRGKVQATTWRLFELLFFVQLPLVLYQHFVVMPGRRGGSVFDAVVGSFGGSIDGGGASPVLVLFTLLVMAYTLARWNRQQCGFGRVLLFWTVGLAIILAGEVKAALVWIPLVALYVLRQRIRARPVAGAGVLLLMAALLAAVFAFYSTTYWSASRARGGGVAEMLVDRATYFFDTEEINHRTGEIGRAASLALWARDPETGFVRRMIGHGPAASRISSTGGLGEVAARFAPLNVAATSVSMMLWDAGLLGCAAFIAMLCSVWLLLHRAAGADHVCAAERAQADALAAMLLMMGSLLVYNRTLNDNPSVQLLLAMAFGCALAWRAGAGAPAKRATTTPIRPAHVLRA